MEFLQALGGFEASRLRHRDAEPSDLLLSSGEPARVRATVFQEPVAASERLLEFGDARAVLGIDAERQAVDEARRSPAGPADSPSIDGVSQTT